MTGVLLDTAKHWIEGCVVERRCLNGVGEARTHHVVVDFGKAVPAYEVGDSLAVMPRNPQSLVDKTLASLGAMGEEEFVHSRSGDRLSLEELFRCRLEIRLVNRKVFRFLVERGGSEELARLAGDRGKMLAVLREWELWDFLRRCRGAIDIQALCDVLPPLLPRSTGLSLFFGQAAA